MTNPSRYHTTSQTTVPTAADVEIDNTSSPSAATMPTPPITTICTSPTNPMPSTSCPDWYGYGFSNGSTSTEAFATAACTCAGSPPGSAIETFSATCPASTLSASRRLPSRSFLTTTRSLPSVPSLTTSASNEPSATCDRPAFSSTVFTSTLTPIRLAVALTGSASAPVCVVTPTVASEPPPTSFITNAKPTSSTSVATVVMMNALERIFVLTSRLATRPTASHDPR